MIYVIGSGPAGVSAAVALIRQGHEVTMLDAGLELEPEREQVLLQMSAGDPAEWATADVTTLKENMTSSAAGIPLKLLAGSDFPYRGADEKFPRDARNVGLLPSFGKGGFGNVWGAAVLPYLESELGGWPIRHDELAPHFESVFTFMGMSAEHDDLEERFPLYTEKFDAPRVSRQAAALLADLDRNRDILRTRGFLYGRSRLAIAARNGGSRECAACGLCMYGCPYGVIYNPATTLRELMRDSRFTYRRGVVVERFRETGGEVRITARPWAGGDPIEFVGSRLYVAAGVLSSTRLLLESTESYDHELSVKDSQYFLLPMLRYRGTPGVSDEGLHTLSQAFIEIFDETLSENSIHLQWYTYNELYRTAIKSTLRAAYPAFRPMSDAFIQRLMAVQGYLHSDLSGAISLRLAPPRDGAPGVMQLEGRYGPQTRRVLKRLTRKLWANRSLLRAVPLAPAMKVSEPGRGFHSGGTLPMRERPGPFETDRLGRPHGFDRVHIVDSSVFPSINASTITLTVMANAYRIAAHDGNGR
jgi:choline dehydrogenase-like flavoprotein